MNEKPVRLLASFQGDKAKNNDTFTCLEMVKLTKVDSKQV